MIKEPYNIKFIMTTKLNQDCLDNFFACIRQMSGFSDHPDAINFKFRLKKYLLGKEVVIATKLIQIAYMKTNLVFQLHYA